MHTIDVHSCKTAALLSVTHGYGVEASHFMQGTSALAPIPLPKATAGLHGHAPALAGRGRVPYPFPHPAHEPA